MTWSPSSWRSHPIAQAPDYADLAQLAGVEARLRTYPPLVFDGEILRLREQLALVEKGEAFLLQGGDCAETFTDFRPETIRDNFRVLLRMAVVLAFGSKRPVVKVGRVAGQYAKPRSSKIETRGQEAFPAYRGDIINGFNFNEADRRSDPLRMEKAYFHSAATLNLLRAYGKGGFTTGQPAEKFETAELFTSHESLLLNYEESLVRSDGESGRAFAGSAHMLWIGERTRQVDGAHVEFASGIANPIGLKCGPELKEDDLIRLIDRLNPMNESGRLVLIPRLGVNRVHALLPKLIRRVQAEGRRAVWCCDPMHGNTSTTATGIKTRSFGDVLAETRAFFEVHRAEGTVPGGVHFELTGRNVSECTGGAQNILEEQLGHGGYETLCDPRLNASQALELAFHLVR